ncbi:hypothetical protein FHG87_017471 [Trinorchestia longiramus]|nr:hypothetical protein FHG87_017471 [Trinorchestia longiramus]
MLSSTETGNLQCVKKHVELTSRWRRWRSTRRWRWNPWRWRNTRRWWNARWWRRNAIAIHHRWRRWCTRWRWRWWRSVGVDHGCSGDVHIICVCKVREIQVSEFQSSVEVLHEVLPLDVIF